MKASGTARPDDSLPTRPIMSSSADATHLKEVKTSYYAKPVKPLVAEMPEGQTPKKDTAAKCRDKRKSNSSEPVEHEAEKQVDTDLTQNLRPQTPPFLAMACLQVKPPLH